MIDPRDEILSSHEMAALVGQVIDAYHRAKGQFGEDDEIMTKLDEASGLLDEVWDMLLEAEREHD